MNRSRTCLLVLVLLSQFWIAGFAVARDCTPAERSAADAQLC